MNYFPYAFEAMVEPHDLGSYRYTVVFLPDEIVQALPLSEHPRLRISDEIAEQAFTGAWQPSRGRWYLMLSKPLLRRAGLAVGSFAEVRFRVEAQDEVEVPPELARAIAGNAQAADAWQAMTAGKQRALAHRVGTAKTAATALRRVAECVNWLAKGETDLRRLGNL